MDTNEKLRDGARAGRVEFEDAFWGVLVHAMTHQAKDDLLALDEVAAEGTFEDAVLPTVRRAWARAVQALALESLVQHGTLPPDIDLEDG